jgi:hypothetical protein
MQFSLLKIDVAQQDSGRKESIDVPGSFTANASLKEKLA